MKKRRLIAHAYASDSVCDISFCELYNAASGLMHFLGKSTGKNDEFPIQLKCNGGKPAQALAKKLMRLDRILAKLAENSEGKIS